MIAVKKFHFPYKLNLVGTRCPASVLCFTVADARQRVEFFHSPRGTPQRAFPTGCGDFFTARRQGYLGEGRSLCPRLLRLFIIGSKALLQNERSCLTGE